jgi:hypothetical protein
VRSLAGIGVLIVLAGCGGGGSASLPQACTQGSAAIMKALGSAPGAVSIGGSTPISHCFVRNASGDDVQILGTFLLPVAQQLGDRARAGDRQAALRLGYLIGAARRGVKSTGIGSEMVRRLEAEATIAPAQRPAYDRGLRAGLAEG